MPAIMLTITDARPIRVHQPVAVTSPPSGHLSPEQIDYLLKQYAAVESATIPRIVLRPPHHDYVSIDSEYIKSTNPKLRSTAATQPDAAETSGSSSYFVPTVRPGTISAVNANANGFDFYFPLSADDVRPDGSDADSGIESAAGSAKAGVEDLNLMYLRHMQPPVQPGDDEPNYYAVLKMTENGGNVKKSATPKKFNPTQKQVNLKGTGGKATVAKLPSGTASGDNHAVDDGEYVYVGQATQQDVVARQPEQRLTPKSVMRTLRAEELNTGEYLPSVLRNGNADGQRITYQMHGFSGPQSYRFGYDTGKG